MSTKFTRLTPFGGPKGRCLSPFTLFEQIPTVQTENMTYIEFLMGLLNQLNSLINLYNDLASVVEEHDQVIGDFPEQLAEMQEAIKTIQTVLNTAIQQLSQAIISGDQNTLTTAKKYTDDEIAKLPSSGGGSSSSSGCAYGALTAAEYDSLQLAAVNYDDYQFTARDYDCYAKYRLLGPDGTVYFQFLDTFTASALEDVFQLRSPPIILGRRYQVEISLGNFSLDGNTPAKLEIVGANSLGNTLPITVPNSGSASVAVIWTQVPTSVRLMSGEDTITGYNAFIKIKPLGEI